MNHLPDCFAKRSLSSHAVANHTFPRQHKTRLCAADFKTERNPAWIGYAMGTVAAVLIAVAMTC